MPKHFRLPCLLTLALLASPVLAVDIHDTRMLAQPAISDQHVAFVYAGDIWLADRSGGTARRLTSHEGDEWVPVFSPDGNWVAFSGEYDGNYDVFVVPVTGGVPTRLTWHPQSDIVQGFTADGSSVVFTSRRGNYTFRYRHLYAVPVTGGMPTRIPLPNADRARFAPDGETIGYNPLGDAFRQWKNYRGGRASRVWLYDVDTAAVEQIPQPPERSNDIEAMWPTQDPSQVFFLSDRDGEFNLYRFDRGDGSVVRLTQHEDFPIVAASPGNGVVVYEQAGYVHVYDVASGSSNRLRIGVAADLVETRPRFVSDASFARFADLSPSGKRAVIGYRGEVVTVPAKKGDVRNLTRTPGAHERQPVWSPDGDHIAYFSDATGEYELHVAPQNGKGEARTYELGGSGFYDDLKFSPDGTKVSYSDNGWSLYWMSLESGAVTKIASEPIYGPDKELHHNWSPDSQWLAYTLKSPVNIQQVYLYDVASGTSHPVTDGLSDVGEPAFDQDGKWLYFLGSTDAGPVRTWFAQSNADMTYTRKLYLAVLPKGETSPLKKESDEEEGSGDAEEDAGEDQGADAGEEKSSEEDADEDDDDRIVVDFDGLDQRILAVPVPSGVYRNLVAGAAGQVYYLRGDGSQSARGPAETVGLYRYDFAKREETKLADQVDGFSLSPDGKKILLVRNRGTSWHLTDAGGKIDLSGSRLDVGRVQVRIDPRAEWRQIFDEVWRINRDFFYDPGMHGADWPAMRARYEAFLPHLATRDDLNRVLQWMCSELAVGHHRVFGGDDPSQADRLPGGLLGADFEVHDGRYRITKVLGGLNWNPELRAPLTEPGVEVPAGSYLLSVNGQPVRPPENLYRYFENTAGSTIELEIAATADGEDARTVEVEPIASEISLRNRDWVEGNLRRVHEATDGRVAYVYVPNTAGSGHAYFKRYFFPQADKQAVIIDERHNGGGQVADYYIDILRRPYISHWATRYGNDFSTPMGAIHGPKVMLIDETAGSGGDLLPWMFSELELGPLIGRPTWGGLVGILGFPVLMDGGFVTAPNLAIWTEDGGFIVENVGVPPDIEVEQLPAEMADGRDPQLEKAIEVVLEMLEADPPPTLDRPAFPIRARRP